MRLIRLLNPSVGARWAAVRPSTGGSPYTLRPRSVVVERPASIGALPLAVARDMSCPVAHLPGLTMRRIADLCPGEAKTDARDAFIIADAARSMPAGPTSSSRCSATEPSTNPGPPQRGEELRPLDQSSGRSL